MNELGERLRLYAQLMRIDRPIGTLLLLWPTLWSLWVAGQGRPSPDIVCIFLAGVFVMRAAGCVVNGLRGSKPGSLCRAYPASVPWPQVRLV